MASRSIRSAGSRFAAAAEAGRQARANRLRRAGWQPGEPYPEIDDQGTSSSDPLSRVFSHEFSVEFS